MSSKTKSKILILLPIAICLIFFAAYCVLSIVKHNSFLTGYDHAIYDQTVWKYSQLKIPNNTVHAYYDTPMYYDHFEPILAVLSPIFWILNYTWVLLIIQVIAVIGGAYVVFKLALLKKVIYPVAIAILIVFLLFYGIQNAIWADFHTLTFAIPFIALYLYLLEKEKYKQAIIPFVLAIICKEDIAMFTLLISGILFIVNRKKELLYFALASILYLLFVFGIFFPYFTDGYRFQNNEGLISNVDLNNFYNTQDKRDAVIYSLASFGFLPLLAPIYLILYVADLAHYFVLGSDYVSSAQGLFLHYRGPLALFLAWPTIIAISRFKKLNKWPIALYLIFCVIIIQYLLHLPLSYLSKSWFWQTPTATQDIKLAMSKINQSDSAATQINIIAHMSHKDRIYTMWPITKDFKKNSPCNSISCKWFRIGHPVKYIIVDTSSSWDARHFLESREDFIEGVNNLEKAKVVKPIFKQNNTTLYEVVGKI